MVGAGVDLDHQAVGADGDRAGGHRTDQVPLAGAVAGVGDDGEVRALAEHGDGGEIEGVAFAVHGANLWPSVATASSMAERTAASTLSRC